MSELTGLLAARGLTSNERKVYQMLLEHGSSHAGMISRRTGIHRRNVYDCLDQMSKKGLVGYMKENNRKVYAITNPQQILEHLESERDDWKTAMPGLLAQYQSSMERRETLFFRGKAGIKQVLEHQIVIGKEVLVQATSVDVSQVLKYFFPKYQLLRKQKRIHTRMLFDADFKTRVNKAKVAELPLCESRFISELNKSPMAQYIYGDNVALVVWGDDPIAILIKQKDVADGFRNNFELLWKMGKN